MDERDYWLAFSSFPGVGPIKFQKLLKEFGSAKKAWNSNSIVKGFGAVVSEYSLGHHPTLGSFPSRNRIIAGLSQGVLVTEGAEDSGSLITADYALKFKRPVFAVPGPITSILSKGPYKLISKGAKLVTSPQDIIDELGIRN